MKYNIIVTMTDGLVVTSKNIDEKYKLDLRILDYTKPFVLAEDNLGVEIMINLNHVKTIKYVRVNEQ